MSPITPAFCSSAEKTISHFNLFLLSILLLILIGGIGLVGWVFANGPEDLGSIPGRVIPKTLKMVLDISLFNTAI